MYIPYNKTRENSEKIIRRIEDYVEKINRIGEMKQIRFRFKKNSETKHYAGLVLNTTPKENYTEIEIINGNTNIGRQTIKIPKEIYEDEKITKIIRRRLIEPNYSKNNQFIPLNQNGEITTEPDKVKIVKKISIEEIEEKIKEI